MVANIVIFLQYEGLDRVPDDLRTVRPVIVLLSEKKIYSNQEKNAYRACIDL